MNQEPGKAALSRKSGPLHRPDSEVADAATRLIRAVGKRAARADVDTASLLRQLDTELEAAWTAAVAGWRQTGFSDSDIGRVLGVTKQAVQQRWPREGGQHATAA